MRVNFDGRVLLQRILTGFPRLTEDEPITGPAGPPGPAGVAITGMFYPWGGDQLGIPEGYLLADGRAVSRTTYAALFAKYKTYYGSGDGVNTFNLPNLIGRFPFGSTSQLTGVGYIPGATGGSSQHQHGASGLDVLNTGPFTHDHGITSSASHNHTAHGTQSNISAMGGQTVVNTSGHSNEGAHDHGGTTAGENQGHDHGIGGTVTSVGHTPPFLNILWLIKT